ncbi:hypothetical protein [uncultured Paludibaculum sp.]|uniref:hypothetical protein n=1 Tax=uncultured Paludibaculum sp. TaxID=1765020 RepID=UPI002AAAD35A|nr:hypothetical protein [uncultured Paludibaculum sp.]
MHAVRPLSSARGADGNRAAANAFCAILSVLWGHPTLAPQGENAHTAAMTLKTAAFLALIGTLLLTVLMAVDFLQTVSGVLNDVVPAMALLRSLVYLVASLSVTVFFYVFNRAQPR